MHTRPLLVLAGIAAGIVGTLCFTGPATPPAAAEAPAPLPIGRFRIAAYPAGPNDIHGAYVLDTATGEVFTVERQEAPRSLGWAKPAK